MGRKLGREGLCLFGGGRAGAGSPSKTMWPGPRPTCVPSFVLIHQTVWPQYTNATDRTERQRSDGIGRTIFLSVCLSVCLSVLSVTLVYCGQTVGRIKMKLGTQVGLGPGHIVLDGDPAPPPQRGTAPQFSGMSVAAKWLHRSRCHLIWR